MRWVLVLTLTACGPTSYSKATSAYPVGPDRWVIEVRGKHIGPALMLEYQQRKAGQVCPNGFDVEQTSGGNEIAGYIITNNGNSNTAVPIKRTNVAAVVRCVNHVGRE